MRKELSMGLFEKKKTVDLSSEIDSIWKRRQVEKKQQQLSLVSTKRHSYIESSQAEFGKTYAIWVEEDGKETMVQAEFLTKGHGVYNTMTFFRRLLKGGKALIHGIQNYSMIKEVGFVREF